MSLKYRINGRQRWYVIGGHRAPWTPKTTRSPAQNIARQNRSRHDSAAKKEEVKTTPTFGEVRLKRLMSNTQPISLKAPRNIDVYWISRLSYCPRQS